MRFAHIDPQTNQVSVVTDSPPDAENPDVYFVALPKGANVEIGATYDPKFGFSTGIDPDYATVAIPPLLFVNLFTRKQRKDLRKSTNETIEDLLYQLEHFAHEGIALNNPLVQGAFVEMVTDGILTQAEADTILSGVTVKAVATAINYSNFI